MLLSLMTLLSSLHKSPRAESAKPRSNRDIATRPMARPSRCFEVLIPFLDPVAARKRGLPDEARQTLTFFVWAADVDRACVFACERFRDHRARNRSARLLPEGPIPLRIAREVEEASLAS